MLESVLHHLARVEKYLSREDVAGIAHIDKNPNGASYKIVNEACGSIHAVCVMSKHIGSDITGLYTAHSELKRLLFPEPA